MVIKDAERRRRTFKNFKLNSKFHWKPVEIKKKRCDMVISTLLKDQSLFYVAYLDGSQENHTKGCCNSQS
jgi:hypothetical protein